MGNCEIMKNLWGAGSNYGVQEAIAMI